MFGGSSWALQWHLGGKGLRPWVFGRKEKRSPIELCRLATRSGHRDTDAARVAAAGANLNLAALLQHRLYPLTQEHGSSVALRSVRVLQASTGCNTYFSQHRCEATENGEKRL